MVLSTTIKSNIADEIIAKKVVEEEEKWTTRIAAMVEEYLMLNDWSKTIASDAHINTGWVDTRKRAIQFTMS